MPSRKTPTTLVWMAGVLIVVGGFLLIRSLAMNRHEGEDVTPGVTDTTNIPNSTSTNTGLNTPVLNSTADYGRVTLKVGETVVFKDMKLKVVSLVEDSRCPKGVQCIQAGTVRVEVQVVSGMGTSTKTLAIGNSATTEGETITFVSVEPTRVYQQNLEPKDYTFTFDVVKKTTATPVATCFVGGCSSEICSDKKDVVSSCIYKAEFACYKTAKCERQPSGQCAFTPTSALNSCLANPPAL